MIADKRPDHIYHQAIFIQLSIQLCIQLSVQLFIPLFPRYVYKVGRLSTTVSTVESHMASDHQAKIRYTAATA